MEYVWAAFLVVGFLVLIKLFGLVERSTEVLAIASHAIAVVRDPALDDAAKEAAMRRNAIRLFALFFLITAGSAAAATLPAGAVWLAGRLTPVSFDAIFEAAGSWEFIAGATLFSIAFVWAIRKQ